MSSAAITKVDFHGDALEAVERDGKVWVAGKSVCRALGVDDRSQQKKLKNKAWAVTVMITAPGTDGKNYQMWCIGLDSLPMWLATIEPSKVAARVRPKLVRFQLEAHRVLRDHFIGRPAELPADPSTTALVSEEFHYHSRAELRDLSLEQVVRLRMRISDVAKIIGCHIQAIYGAIRRECQVLSYLRIPQYKLQEVENLITAIREGRLRVKLKQTAPHDPRQLCMFNQPRNALRMLHIGAGSNRDN